MTERVHFTVYDTATGDIFVTGICPEDVLELQAGPSQTAIPGASDTDAQYVYNGIITNKDALPVSIDKVVIRGDGVDSAIISNIPAGSLVQVNEDRYIVDDGVFELTADMPGSILVKIDSFPYLAYEIEIVVS